MATYKGYEFPDDATIAEMEAAIAGLETGPSVAEPASDEIDYGSMGPIDLATEAAYSAPGSFAGLAGDLYTAVTNPIDTLDAVTKLGAGALQLMLPDELVDMVGRDQESIDMARNVGKFYADRYGSVEAAKKAIATDPAGVLADLSTIILGGGAAVRTAGSMSKIAPVERAGTAIQSAGGAIEPLSAVAKGATKTVAATAPMAANITAQVLGRTTGVGETPLQEAYKAGREGGTKQEALSKTMSGELDFDAALTEANNVMQKMKDERAAQYQQNMAGINTVPEVIDYGVVQSSIDAARKRVSRTGVTDPDNMAMNVLDKAESLVDRFKQGGFNSPLDADDLKRQLWQLEESIADVSKTKNQTARNALKDVRNAVKAEIELAAPQYHKAMKDFSEASDIIDEISVELKVGDRKKASQALKRLQSAMRNNVYTGYGHRLKNVQRLEEAGGETIMPMLAGQALSESTPRGIPVAGVGTTAGGYTLGGFPGLIAGAGMASPRLMGELAKGAGQAARISEKTTRIPRGLLQAAGQPELINLMQQAELQRQRGLLQ
jgi:hypothetical protein